MISTCYSGGGGGDMGDSGEDADESQETAVDRHLQDSSRIHSHRTDLVHAITIFTLHCTPYHTVSSSDSVMFHRDTSAAGPSYRW